jgi:NitT/TauT family transport system ATP-binding protein
MIRFEKVYMSFNGKTVLRDISFTIRTNECVSVLGPSGAGKTTILRLITGSIYPDSGSIKVSELRTGYIFQEPRLLPWRTALDNVSLGLRAIGKSKAEANEIATSWLDKLGLKGFEHYYPAQLSGGMQQRVSIGRALAIGPDLLILDEPFSHLDTELKDYLLTMMQELLAEYHPTVVYVTHDLLEALTIADRIFRLTTGSSIEEYDLSDREAIIHDYVFKYTKLNASQNTKVTIL